MSKFHISTQIFQGNELFCGIIFTAQNSFTRPPVATNFKSDNNVNNYSIQLSEGNTVSSKIPRAHSLTHSLTLWVTSCLGDNFNVWGFFRTRLPISRTKKSVIVSSCEGATPSTRTTSWIESESVASDVEIFTCFFLSKSFIFRFS